MNMASQEDSEQSYSMPPPQNIMLAVSVRVPASRKWKAVAWGPWPSVVGAVRIAEERREQGFDAAIRVHPLWRRS